MRFILLVREIVLYFYCLHVMFTFVDYVKLSNTVFSSA